MDPKLIYQANLRTAKATDVYIARGDPAGETFYPRFTYHGARYAQVTGLKQLTADMIEYHHFHSAIEAKTGITFKSATLTKLYAMGVGSQRSNAMTVQTDCDQRDERLGWMGDANLSGDSIAVNFNANSYLLSYLQTMNDELNPDGSSVDTAPSVRYGGRPGDISWTTAYIALPYAMYKTSGDTAAASTYLEGLVAHIGNIERACAYTAGPSCPQKYGDWVPPSAGFNPGHGQGPKPSKSYTSAFSYVDAVGKVAELAAAAGNAALAAELKANHTKLAADFNKAYFNATTNLYDNGVMTTSTLPLHMGIVPASAKAALQTNLLNRLMTTNKAHTDTGIIGFKFLFEQLAAMGRADDALTVLETTSFPSIGFMGYNKYEPATENVWELWDGYTEGTGMNSRNHHMFSSFTKYMVEIGGGVAQVEGSAGFHDVVLKAAASSSGLSGASVTTTTDHGVLNFTWERAGGLQCSRTPEGTAAELSCGVGGGTIDSVRFASFGRPIGACGGFGLDSGCHADAVAVVEKLCKGRATCTIPATVDALGVPCASSDDGAPHRLHVEVGCSNPPAVHASASVPVTTKATLVLPAAGMSTPVLTTTEGEEYADVARTVDEHGKEVVVVALGSGNHKFTLAAAEPAVVAVGKAYAGSATVACPAGHHANHVRFASFGNPTANGGGAGHLQGQCHLGSAIIAAENACLGKQACTVAVDAGRIAGEPLCKDVAVPALVVELECVANGSPVVVQL